jgi:hypothetical protein
LCGCSTPLSSTSAAHTGRQFEDTDITGRRQLRPLSASQDFAHFQGHGGIFSFHFAAGGNNPVDLAKNRVTVQGVGCEQACELRFFFLEQLGRRDNLQPMILKRSFDFEF